MYLLSFYQKKKIDSNKELKKKNRQIMNRNDKQMLLR